MVAFRVTSSRLLHWIHALDILYYEFLGNSEEYDIKWEDDPIERKNPSDLKTITISLCLFGMHGLYKNLSLWVAINSLI
jgi:hypothetical protein